MEINLTLLPKVCSNKYIVQKWLDTKVSDPYIRDKFTVFKYTLPPYFAESDNFKTYYSITDDQDVVACNKHYKNYGFYKHLDDYTDHNILIAPNTNRYHVNYLFKQLIDHCSLNSMFVEEEDNRGKIHVLALFDKNFKDKFYEFCYNNTTNKN
jgi:hypothetical protein